MVTLHCLNFLSYLAINQSSKMAQFFFSRLAFGLLVRVTMSVTCVVTQGGANQIDKVDELLHQLFSMGLMLRSLDKWVLLHNPCALANVLVKYGPWNLDQCCRFLGANRALGFGQHCVILILCNAILLLPFINILTLEWWRDSL